MKVLAINGSSREKGNTNILLEKALEPLREKGFECENLWLGNNSINVCLGCRKCAENKNNKCIIESDEINNIINKMTKADAIILGSPVYVASVSAQMKSLIDRACLVARANGFLLKHKIGASVAAVRRAGAITTIDNINHFFLINQMYIVGSTYWNFGVGTAIGEVSKDEEGLHNMRNLGKNIAWILEKINNFEG